MYVFILILFGKNPESEIDISDDTRFIELPSGPCTMMNRTAGPQSDTAKFLFSKKIKILVQ